MPFLLIRDDITKVKCDAVVNAANKTLLGGGGVDGAIHAAAGPELLAECRTLGGCGTGEAKLTGAYRLPAKYVIHTVGPVWRGGMFREKALLAACYENSLRLAKEAGCGSVAFPLISAGAYGYPKEKALDVAAQTIEAFLKENDMLVYLVFFDKTAFDIGKKRFREIESVIDGTYVAAHTEDPGLRAARQAQAYADFCGSADAAAGFAAEAPAEAAPAAETPPPACYAAPCATPAPTGKKRPRKKEKAPAAAPAQKAAPGSLEAALGMLDESFSEMLLRKIDEKGITDAACYKRANIDRKLFSKIRSDRLYKPRKTTALAFAVALELSPEETGELLLKAGYALSHSSKFDIIVEYFIARGRYDIFEINEALFAFDQPLLS